MISQNNEEDSELQICLKLFKNYNMEWETLVCLQFSVPKFSQKWSSKVSDFNDPYPNLSLVSCRSWGLGLDPRKGWLKLHLQPPGALCSQGARLHTSTFLPLEFSNCFFSICGRSVSTSSQVDGHREGVDGKSPLSLMVDVLKGWVMMICLIQGYGLDSNSQWDLGLIGAGPGLLVKCQVRVPANPNSCLYYSFSCMSIITPTSFLNTLSSSFALGLV